MRTKVASELQEELYKFNPILADGEIIFEKDTKRFKVGDGKSRYKDLDYITDPMLGFYFGELICGKSAILPSFVYSFILMFIPTVIWDKFRDLPTIYIIGIFVLIYLFIYSLVFNKIKKDYL